MSGARPEITQVIELGAVELFSERAVEEAFSAKTGTQLVVVLHDEPVTTKVLNALAKSMASPHHPEQLYFIRPESMATVLQALSLEIGAAVLPNTVLILYREGLPVYSLSRDQLSTRGEFEVREEIASAFLAFCRQGTRLRKRTSRTTLFTKDYIG